MVNFVSYFQDINTKEFSFDEFFLYINRFDIDMMSQQLNMEGDSTLTNIGIYETKDGYKFGVIIRHKDQQKKIHILFVTLAKYFDNCKEAQIQIEILWQDNDNPKKLYSKGGEKIKVKSQAVDHHRVFVDFQLPGISQFSQAFDLIPQKQLGKFDWSKGRIIQANYVRGKISIEDEEFSSFLPHLRLKKNNALILLQEFKETKLKQQSSKLFFYGFYNYLGDDEECENYFLPKDFLSQPQSTQEVKSKNSKGQQQNDPLSYQSRSTGMLVYEDKQNNIKVKGTFCFLRTKEYRCKYLITCAHNLCLIKKKINSQEEQVLNLTKNIQNIKIYQLKPSDIYTPMNCKLQEETTIKVETVYVNPFYQKYLGQKVEQYNNKGKYDKAKIQFPQSKDNDWCEKDQKSIKIQQYIPFDIAIIELKEQLKKDYEYGFQIITQFNPDHIIGKKAIFVTGFPSSIPDIGVKEGTMYYQSTEERSQSCIQLSTDKRLLKHKLFAYEGNSGSPLYYSLKEQTEEKNKNKKYGLLGVHTTGVLYKKVNTNNYEGPFNYAVYLYNQDILSWLSEIIPNEK